MVTWLSSDVALWRWYYTRQLVQQKDLPDVPHRYVRCHLASHCLSLQHDGKLSDHLFPSHLPPIYPLLPSTHSIPSALRHPSIPLTVLFPLRFPSIRFNPAPCFFPFAVRSITSPPAAVVLLCLAHHHAYARTCITLAPFTLSKYICQTNNATGRYVGAAVFLGG